MKEQMIEIFFYIGYSVGVIALIALFILIGWLIFFRLLRFKKIRNSAMNVILINEINSLNDNDFANLQQQIIQARRKYKNTI